MTPSTTTNGGDPDVPLGELTPLIVILMGEPGFASVYLIFTPVTVP